MGGRAFVTVLAVIGFFSSIAHAEIKPIFKDSPTKLEVQFGKPFEVSLRSLLKDPNVPGTLAWQIKEQPTWLQLDLQKEKLQGNPTQMGTFDFRISVASGEGGDLDHKAQVRVTAKPEFKSPEFDFGIQKEGEDFSFDLQSAVTNPSGEGLAFKASNLPKWMSLSGSKLVGTPTPNDIGNYVGVSLEASNSGGTTTAKAHGTVIKVFKTPKWVSKEIKIDDAWEDAPYSKIVSGYVLNPESANVRYEIVSQTPPPWLNLGATSGELFGTPLKENVKAVSVNIRLIAKVGEIEYDDTTTFKFNVIHVNHPPKWVAKPLDLPATVTGTFYAQDLGKSATDSDDNDALHFQIDSFQGPGAVWAALDSQGRLVGTPEKGNVGLNTFQISVLDNAGLKDTTTVRIAITKANEPPKWISKPTTLPEGAEDKLYGADLSALTTDPDGDKLFFTKLEGPAWVSISNLGILSGTPKAGDAGTISIRVRVSDNISGNDVTDLKILIAKTNHPPQWILNPITLAGKEDATMNVSLAPWVKDVDGDKLTFDLYEGAPWVKISNDGMLSGTPTMENVGENRIRVRVTDAAGLNAIGVVIVNVAKVNKKPFWIQSTMTLASAKENDAYNISLADLAKDPDGDKLTFGKVNGPSWASVSEDGHITGTPKKVDVGGNSIEVRVMDPSMEFAIGTVKILVEKFNSPPKCRQNPIELADGLEDVSYNFNLTNFVSDEDNDALKFKFVSYTGQGQAWIFVGEKGDVTGLPQKSNMGAYSIVFEVNDGIAGTQCQARGQVLHKNHPPVISPNIPTFTVKQDQVLPVDLTKYVTDSDNDKLNFILDTPMDWITLPADGKLVARPKLKHVGDNDVRFKVDDGVVGVVGYVRIKVLEAPRPPIWVQDPVTLEGTSGALLQGSLLSYVKEMDGRPLTFTKKSGKAWLGVNTNGSIAGTPTSSDAGSNAFTITACNDKGLCTDGQLIVNVQAGGWADTVALDAPVDGARAESLWIVDYSTHSSKAMESVKDRLHIYFSEMDSLKIRHNDVLVSADAYKWDGLPIREGSQPLLVTSSDPYASKELIRRFELSQSYDTCSNCFNSPIWAIFRFHERVKDLSEIYQNGFINPSVPLDVMILTSQRDHFPALSKNKAQYKGWTSQDYAKHLLDRLRGEKKAYRISAITTSCPTLVEKSGDASSAAPEEAYRLLTQQTGGTFHASCTPDYGVLFKEHAQLVSSRALLHAKNRIKLSRVPKNPTNIHVSIGSIALTSDKWKYESATNEVLLFWELIETQIKGTELRIEYAAN